MAEITNTDPGLYGTFETNTLADTGINHSDTDNSEDVYWTDSRLVRIIRIRLLSDPGPYPYDVSYVLGVLDDGRQVHVQVPFYHLSRRGYMSEMYKLASADGINLNRLCGGHVRDVLSRLI